MKNTLRILTTAALALVVGYAPATLADTVAPCKETTCSFAITASGTVAADGHAVSIILQLVGSPLSNVNHPNYGITTATGTVTIDGTTYSGVSLVGEATPGTSVKAPTGWGTDIGTLTYDNKLLGNGAHYLSTAGLLLEIPGLNGSKTVKQVPETSDYWILEWHANDGGYYELQNALATTDIYKLGTLTATTTPEPVTLVLFGTGLAGIGGMVRRRLLG